MIQSISMAQRRREKRAYRGADIGDHCRCQSSRWTPDYDYKSANRRLRFTRADPGARIGASAVVLPALVCACEAIGEGANSAMKSPARKKDRNDQGNQAGRGFWR